MAGNPIPTAARKAVQERSGGRCEACGGRGGEIHHRRSRRVRDGHTHCLCVLIHLCRTCHATTHRSPLAGSVCGLMISQWETQPSSHGFEHYSLGWVTPSCDGRLVSPGKVTPGYEKEET